MDSDTARKEFDMAEEKVFARKASGLVRGLSLVDAFGVGFMNQGLTPSMWVMISLGLSVYTGGNLIIATLLSAVLCGIGFSLVWGILGGSMPRSGGEYIYNSRIISPLIGIAESFGNAFVWIMWIYVLAPWTVDPGLVMLFQFLGMPQAADFLRQPIAFFLIATVVNLAGLLFLVFGIKFFARAQKVVMVLGILGTVVILLVFSFTSHGSFVQAWNGLAAQYGSLDYNSFLAAAKGAMEEAGKALPNTWNWFDTLGVMVAGSWLFAYSYCITFIAGEVKRPDKSIILGNLFAILVPAFFMLWLGIVLYRTVGFQFLSATAYVDETLGGELAGYTLPWSPNFVGLAAVITRSPILLILMAGSFILFSLWWVALSYLAFPRILFAWGMDRMGPRWFTDINPRWATPVKNHILCFILGEIGIGLYVLWQEQMSGLSVTGLEIVSVFGVTAIAATIFPFIRKVRHIWDASPYKRWRILGIPAITIGGIVNLIYLAILFVFFIVMPDLEGLAIGSLIFYAIIWGLGIVWYYFWKARNRRVGIDVSMAYGELPPE
jgi:APA family basic amino acid/polyamine antiporter